MLEIIFSYLFENWIKIAVTVSLVLTYLVLDRFSTPKIVEGADQGRFKDNVVTKAVVVARSLIAIIGFLVFIITWGVDLTSVLVFATTSITLLGVALFASWSVLSNITAFFILLVHPSFRRGNFIRILDADNYVEGYIADVTLFNTKLITESRETIVYPNNLVLGKPCIINPRDRRNGVGKMAPETSEQWKAS